MTDWSPLTRTPEQIANEHLANINTRLAAILASLEAIYDIAAELAPEPKKKKKR